MCPQRVVFLIARWRERLERWKPSAFWEECVRPRNKTQNASGCVEFLTILGHSLPEQQAQPVHEHLRKASYALSLTILVSADDNTSDVVLEEPREISVREDVHVQI